MEKTGKILFYVLLLFLCISCVRKKENVEQKHEIFQEEIKRNELYLFFDTIIKRFPPREIEGVRSYYFIFKKTDTNDTLFLLFILQLEYA